MPQIISEAEIHFGQKWNDIKEDFTHCILREFVTGINLWEKAFESGGFRIVEKTHVNCFYARIVAKKVI
jgi:hypothetical protein